MSNENQQPYDGWSAPRSRSGQPPQPYTPYQPPKKKHTGRNVLILVGAVVGIIVVAGVAGGNKSNGNAAATSPTTPAAPSTTDQQPVLAPATTQAPVTTQAAPSTTVALSLTGNGVKQTKKFPIANSDWSIGYTFDCSSFGSQGNFQIYVYDDSGNLVDAPVNELSANGNDKTYEHNGPGTYYLEVNSECNWTVKATDGDTGQ